MTRQHAADLLVDLLTAPSESRARWEQIGTPRGRLPYNVTAIGVVLAGHLRRHDRIDEFDELEWPRRRRHWLGDRLSGRTLHHVDLDDFATAFAFTSQDTRRLHALLDAPDGAMPLSADDDLEIDTSPRGYRSIEIVDDHVIGPDRRPVRHETHHVIEAVTDGVHRFWYSFDTNAAAVEVMRGGKSGPLQRRGESYWGVPIELDETLARGERTTLNYVTTFSYAEAPPPEFRRWIPADGDTEVAATVHFWPSDPPTMARQAIWTEVDADTAAEQDVVLDETQSAHTSFTSTQGVVVGMRWSWNRE